MGGPQGSPSGAETRQGSSLAAHRLCLRGGAGSEPPLGASLLRAEMDRQTNGETRGRAGGSGVTGSSGGPKDGYQGL